jgi:hypothetical protein
VDSQPSSVGSEVFFCTGCGFGVEGVGPADGDGGVTVGLGTGSSGTGPGIGGAMTVSAGSVERAIGGGNSGLLGPD